MPRLSLVFTLALAVSALLGQAQAYTTQLCKGTNTFFPSAGPFGGGFNPGTTLVVTEPITVASQGRNSDVGKDVYNLGVTLAASSVCTGSTGSVKNVHAQIGLYTLSTSGTPGPNQVDSYTLVTRTNDIKVDPATITNGGTVSADVTFSLLAPVSSTANYYIGFATTSPSVCLVGTTNGATEDAYPFTYDSTSTLPTFFTASGTNPNFEASALVCTGGTIVGDPVFTGFHGQQFTVKGEADAVFNLISSPTLSFNNRFVSLESAADSMDSAAMKKVRASFKQSKLLDLAKTESVNRPPVTTAWNHPGTYMGESGLTLGESQLYVAPGAYATGFSAITLDGKALPISSTPVELDGDMTVTRPTAFKVIIATPSIRFTIVNADHFVNIEHGKVLSADAQLTGLLGQTADAEWEVVQSAEFTQHIENDYKVASNKLF